VHALIPARKTLCPLNICRQPPIFSRVSYVQIPKRCVYACAPHPVLGPSPVRSGAVNTGGVWHVCTHDYRRKTAHDFTGETWGCMSNILPCIFARVSNSALCDTQVSLYFGVCVLTPPACMYIGGRGGRFETRLSHPPHLGALGGGGLF